MGCRTSKIARPQVDMLPKLPPILSRRLEEIRRYRAEGALSKKQLLKDGSENDSGSGNDINERKSVSSADPDKGSIGSPKVEPEPTKPVEATFSSERKVIGAKDKSTEHNNNDNNKDKGNAKEIDKQEDEAVTKAMGKLALEETNDEQEIEDQYGRFSNVEGSLICPASPSFRIYYIESLEDKEDDCKNDYMNKGSLSDTDVASSKSSEESAAKTKKKGRKGVKLRRVIPKGKPVRKFLSVKSCYYPSCGGRLEISHLVSAKSATT